MRTNQLNEASVKDAKATPLTIGTREANTQIVGSWTHDGAEDYVSLTMKSDMNWEKSDSGFVDISY